MRSPMAPIRTFIAAVLWFWLAVFAEAQTAAVRVVSQTVGTDELLLAVAEPSQIAALSHLSRDPAFSGISEEAKGYPQLALNADLESLLQYRPTLVLCADYSRAELVAQARRVGLNVVIITRYEPMPDA
jgi:iron complex transport system substrate-binding protein